jgi:short-subunit dehydrogenase
LRQELYKTGVSVTIVSPGRVDTPMIDHLRVPSIQPKAPPEAVAHAILRAIRRRQPEVIIPWIGWLLYLSSVLSPRFTDWAVRLLHLEGWEQ